MKKQKIIKVVILCILNLVFILLSYAAIWGIIQFGRVNIDEMIYNATMSVGDADLSFLNDLWYELYVEGMGIILLFIAIKSWMKKKHKTFSKIVVVGGTILNFTVFIILINVFFMLPQYLYDVFHPSTFIEENYKAPENVSISFPDQKRNLIYIYLESMESSYMDRKNGGLEKENLIPELTTLCKENINFSGNQHTGGFYMVKGAEYTSASFVAQTSGLPLKLQNNELLDKSDFPNFLPGCYSLGQILKKEGYTNQLMVDDEASFGGIEDYCKQHGEYENI